MAGTTRQTEVRGPFGAVDAPRARSARDGRRWSLRFGRAFGIELYAHVTFLALIVWSGATSLAMGQGLAGAAAGMGFVAAVFAIVILHELGHALAARSFGIPTRDITLYPFGGVASLERMPREPKQELAIAVAGPAVNVALALSFGALSVALGGVPLSFAIGLSPGSVLGSLAGINVTLAVFNLLPAFPMDGGRVLRALLALRMDRVRATRVAATVGQGLAVGLGLLGLMGNPILLLIAAFVWIGAGAEAGAVEADARLSRQLAERAMITDFRTLAPGDPLSRAVDLTLAGAQKDFPVVDGGRVVGMLSQAAVLRGLRDQGAAAAVSGLMAPPLTAPAGASLADLLAEIRRGEGEGEGRAVCILRGERLVGMVDLDNIVEFLRIQAALGS